MNEPDRNIRELQLPCLLADHRQADLSIRLVAVFDPLEGVAVHVVETERVRRERSHRGGLIEPDVTAVGLAAQARFFLPEVAVVAISCRPRDRPWWAGPRRVFPLGIREQTINVVEPGLPVQPPT